MADRYEPPEARPIEFPEDIPLLIAAWDKGLESFSEPWKRKGPHPQARKDRIWRGRK